MSGQRGGSMPRAGNVGIGSGGTSASHGANVFSGGNSGAGRMDAGEVSNFNSSKIRGMLGSEKPQSQASNKNSDGFNWQQMQDFGTSTGASAPLGSVFLGVAKEEKKDRLQRMADVEESSKAQSGDPNKQIGEYSFLTEDLYIAPDKANYEGDFAPNSKTNIRGHKANWDREQANTFLGEWGANTEQGAAAGAQSGGWVGAIIGAVIGTGIGVAKGGSRIKSDRRAAKEFAKRMQRKYLQDLEAHRKKRGVAEDQLTEENRKKDVADYKANKAESTNLKFQKNMSQKKAKSTSSTLEL